MPSVSLRIRWTRLLAGGVASALATILVLAAIPTLFGTPRPMVRIYWRNISDPDRITAEQRFRFATLMSRAAENAVTGERKTTRTGQAK